MRNILWCAAGAAVLAGGFVGAVRYGARHPQSALGRWVATADPTGVAARDGCGPGPSEEPCPAHRAPCASEGPGAGPVAAGPLAAALAGEVQDARAGDPPAPDRPAPPAIVIPDEDEPAAARDAAPAGGAEGQDLPDAGPAEAGLPRPFMPYCDDDGEPAGPMPYAPDNEAAALTNEVPGAFPICTEGTEDVDGLIDELFPALCPGCSDDGSTGHRPAPPGKPGGAAERRAVPPDVSNGCCDEVCPYVPPDRRPAAGGPEKHEPTRPAPRRVKAGYRGDPDARPRVPVDTTEFRPTDAARDEYRWGPF
jgi:hypothetical protein